MTRHVGFWPKIAEEAGTASLAASIPSLCYGDEVHRVIDAIDKQHVYLSADNREKLAFWRDGEEA